ncbi:hypothetical protein PA08_1113 [Cutibacterium modestum P08]|nr:hypothetical protein HMPREF9621_00688 [Cutibacterium modestum HL037PA2]EGG26876.1 hypothetical protein PA08_1113 [Cutibacterium modestum P08]
MDQRKVAFADIVKVTGESPDAAANLVETAPCRSIWRVEGPGHPQVTASADPLS